MVILLEGAFTLLIGIFFLLLDGPLSCADEKLDASQGLFTDREVKIVVNRILRDDPTKGSMHNRQD